MFAEQSAFLQLHLDCGKGEGDDKGLQELKLTHMLIHVIHIIWVISLKTVQSASNLLHKSTFGRGQPNLEREGGIVFHCTALPH